LLEPAGASADQFRAWREADRYSLAEIAALADGEAFFSRRARFHEDAVVGSLRSYFHGQSGFSAADIALLFARPAMRTARLARFIEEAFSATQHADSANPDEVFLPSRILHSLGTAIETMVRSPDQTLGQLVSGIGQAIAPERVQWLSKSGLEPLEGRPARDWARQAKARAFEHLQRAIVGSGEAPKTPQNALRSDEIVWGRSPVRLDLAGGWTDTPPFALEHGGCVTNAAVTLNGQPPIQVYARVTPEPFILIHSIDLGTDSDIREWSELLDFSSATGEFSLVKVAIVLAGFTPAACPSANGSLKDLLERFGGGLELTTLAAVPKGSGLGTSSIMGAVVLAVIHRVLGRELSSTELFHAVLRLEQALTTGGGWQDQIGGVLGGVKLITTRPGLVPDPTVRYVPPDVLDPKANGSQTLLYYTGITRLAKNILAQVVGRYLDRNRAAMATLRRIQALAPEAAEAMARKDLAAFGDAIDAAWVLNKELDPESSNPQIEAILARVRPHIYGAKLLGAGGGGFLLLVCKSPQDAVLAKRQLESQPPNPRARFFDFAVSQDGLAISVC
jgi:galactokinase/mevalonate kinase-like predicted kinase